MVEIINQLAENFGNHAILKGGMELRLLDCQRFTNDLDYVFTPYTSKNDVKVAILSVLQRIPDVRVLLSVHSTCIRYTVMHNSVAVNVEVNVATYCQSEVLTTGMLAIANNQQPRLIRVMSFDIALAHKLAAWIERRLIRDLYDASFIKSVLNVSPDMNTLQQRLSSLSLRNKKIKKVRSLTLLEFIDALESAVSSLEQKDVEVEMRDYFLPDQLFGLSLKIKVGIAQILDFLKTQ